MMLQTGTFLQNRYEIISCIGSGGMADVYKARDHKLNRFVAVKVLKAEFKDDKAFLSKFRVEAQAAAGLAHANIVNVYDVGEENGISFIVMELVDGITLKSYIAKKGKLSVREATSIALQVAAGLEAAHNNGIVHRDVKPQNIIISMDGKAKVADFGIARAADSNTINSSAMGSVHYSSPEQTRGGYSDAKSDIYSMGITMFEMVTGRVPFDGDSTVEVALKHLQEEIPSPKKFTPEIPFSTEQIILKCTQKSPDRRYANMSELIRDLKESLVNPGGNFVVIPSVDIKAHTIELSRDEVNAIRSGSMPVYNPGLNIGAADTIREKGNVQGEGRMYPYGGNYYQNSGYQDLRHNQRSADPGEGYTPSSYDSPYYDRMDYLDDLPEDGYLDDDDRYGEYDENAYRRASKDEDLDDEEKTPVYVRILTVLGAIVLVIALLFVLRFAAKALGLIGRTGGGDSGAGSQTVTTEQQQAPVQNTTLTLPDLTNNTQAEAENALVAMGLEYKIDNSRFSDSIEAGRVIVTNPGAGSTVSSSETITVFISQGSDSSLVEVPNVVGGYVGDASTVLSNYGLYAYITEEVSDTVEKGLVISQDIPPETMVPSGSSVTITVSLGPESAPAGTGADGGVWMCNVQLPVPDGYSYNDEPVRVELEQGEVRTVIADWAPISFPYFLNVTGQAGIPTGTVYIYIQDPETQEVRDTLVYSDIPFEEAD